MFISSLPAKTLSLARWISAVVRHWRVETAHQILDTAFAEDQAPWIRANTNGMLVMLVLRRIAMTLLPFFALSPRTAFSANNQWRVGNTMSEGLSRPTGCRLRARLRSGRLK
ncbi:MAG: hypothetical protein AAF654_12695 [Myxococcota bacterium]